jgi:hypothetical protein
MVGVVAARADPAVMDVTTATQLAPPAPVQLVQVRSAYGIANTLAAPAGYVVGPATPVPGATLGLSAAAQALLHGRVTAIKVIEAGDAPGTGAPAGAPAPSGD